MIGKESSGGYFCSLETKDMLEHTGLIQYVFIEYLLCARHSIHVFKCMLGCSSLTLTSRFL